MTVKNLFLRVSVTDNCQLRCCYCRPAHDDKVISSRRNLLSAEDLFKCIRAIHQAKGIAKLRFTGGEPLLRRDLIDLIAACRNLDIPDLSLTTNGQMLEGRAVSLKESGLSRINVSLDSLKKGLFSTITRGGDLTATLQGIAKALQLDMKPLKLNAVIMRGVNDDELVSLLEFALAHGCLIRFLELMPIGVAAAEFQQRFISSESMLEILKDSFQFEPLPYEAGATSRDYYVSNSSGVKGICGFISASSHPFCVGCKRLRLTADGYLLGCLAQSNYTDLNQVLTAAADGDLNILHQSINEAFMAKKAPHDLAMQSDMAGIGG